MTDAYSYVNPITCADDNTLLVSMLAVSTENTFPPSLDGSVRL